MRAQLGLGWVSASSKWKALFKGKLIHGYLPKVSDRGLSIRGDITEERKHPRPQERAADDENRDQQGLDWRVHARVGIGAAVCTGLHTQENLVSIL